MSAEGSTHRRNDPVGMTSMQVASIRRETCVNYMEDYRLFEDFVAEAGLKLRAVD